MQSQRWQGRNYLSLLEPEMGGVSKASAPGLGVAQSWQSSAYTNGTVRQNTTGRPIAVSVSVSAAGTWTGSVCVLEIGSANPPTTIAAQTQSPSGGAMEGHDTPLFGIVPHGHYYRVREPAGGSPEYSASTMLELK